MDKKTKSKICIFIKREVYPIGEVLGVITSWADVQNESLYGEVFFTKQNNQTESELFKKRIKINYGDLNASGVDIIKLLTTDMKLYHNDKNLAVESARIPAYEYNPYLPNRFEWKELQESEIVLLIESYGSFFDFILDKTQNKDLKDKIVYAKKLNSLFVFEEIK